jgi:hypothetical protein
MLRSFDGIDMRRFFFTSPDTRSHATGRTPYPVSRRAGHIKAGFGEL